MTTPERDEELALYVISVAAELSGLHPQTLRQYDRLGLVSPSRAQGRGRRYSLRDIALLRHVSRMVNEGINLAGIKRIIELESAMSNMAIEVAKLRIEVDSLLMENRVEKINNNPLFNALPGREVKQITRINTEE